MRTKIITLLTLSMLGLSTASMADTSVKAATTANQAANTQLRQNLLTLTQSLKQMQAQAVNKQNSMAAELQTKAPQAKTPEQKQALQKATLTDIINFKMSQVQGLKQINLTEPRVKAVRDTMVSALNSDIKANQIVLNNPNPTPATKQAFTAEMNNMQKLHQQANTQLVSLMKEAGLPTQSATPSKK